MKYYKILLEIVSILEIFANIGAFSIYATKKYPDGLIFSYEPDVKNYQTLLKNLSINKQSYLKRKTHQKGIVIFISSQRSKLSNQKFWSC